MPETAVGHNKAEATGRPTLAPGFAEIQVTGCTIGYGDLIAQLRRRLEGGIEHLCR